MITKGLIPAFALALCGVAHADTTVFAEDFEGFSSTTTKGWVLVNNSVSPTGTGWFGGNSGIFSAAAGSVDSYAAANFTGTTAPNGAIRDWLISPQFSTTNGDSLSFKVRGGDSGYLDTLQVYVNPTGTAATTGFTALLGSFASSTDSGWITLSYTVSGLAAPGVARIGFLYTVADVSTAGGYLGLDSVLITTAVPEPTSALMLALGLVGIGGLVSARRRD